MAPTHGIIVHNANKPPARPDAAPEWGRTKRSTVMEQKAASSVLTHTKERRHGSSGRRLCIRNRNIEADSTMLTADAITVPIGPTHGIRTTFRTRLITNPAAM